jgi:RNA polymerase sigma-70 factor (ECF subfamily)
LDVTNEENRYSALEIPDTESPESLFEKQWVMTLLNHVVQRLEQEQCSSGKHALFADLKPHLRNEVGLQYAELAIKHGVTEGSIKVAVHRLRHRYGAILRDEIGRTVSSIEEVEAELRHLIRVISE